MPVQGTAFEDSLQTITYSTFSLIDTVYMRDDGFLPKPKLDTIRVEANGDIYVRVELPIQLFGFGPPPRRTPPGCPGEGSQDGVYHRLPPVCIYRESLGGVHQYYHINM